MKTRSIIASLLIALIIGMSQMVSAAPATPAVPARATLDPTHQPTMSLVVIPQETTPGGSVRIAIAVQDGDGRAVTVWLRVDGAARWSLSSTGTCTRAACQITPPGMVWIAATAGTQPITIDADLITADGVPVATVHGRVQVASAPTPTPRGSHIYLPLIQR